MQRPCSWVGSFAFGLAFVVNPAFLMAGCFSYGEKEAVALVAVAGDHKTYRFTTNGADFEATLELRQASTPTPKLSSNTVSFVASAHACSERTFVRSAGACLNITRVPVEGTLRVIRAGGAPAEVQVRGDVEIQGLAMQSALLALSSPSGATALFSSPDGKAFALYSLSMPGSDRIEYRIPVTLPRARD